jgi:Tfp pilus assembly protein PilN
MRAVNLIPSDVSRGGGVGAGRSQGGAYGVLGLLAGLALLVLLYGVAHHQIASRRTQVATLTARAQREQAAVAQLSPYTSFLALREQRMQAVSQLVDSRFDWAHAMHELGRVLPEDASISSLDGTIGSSSTSGSSSSSTSASTASSTAKTASQAVSSATPPGSVPVITLSGCATSQSEVALTLQRLRLMDGVSSVNLQSSANGGSGGGAGAGAGGASEQCGQGKPTFTAQVTFDPLPSASSSASSATKITTSSGGGQ